MEMRKINDRLYEFFVGTEDTDIEITDVDYTEVEEKIDYSKYEYYFGEDDCELLEEYRNEKPKSIPVVKSKPKSLSLPKPVVEEVELIDHEDVEVISKPKTKKDELLESLSYLKSKPFKTKQDRESIYTLEVVLKNMK
jgi:hypothetical protein